MPNQKRLVAEIEKQSQVLGITASEVFLWSERLLQKIKDEFEGKKSNITDLRSSRMETCLFNYERSVSEIQNQVDQISSGFGLAELGWDSMGWQGFQPDRKAPIQKLTRFGWLVAPGIYESLSFPALLPIIGGRNVLIRARGGAKEKARNLLQSIMLRLVAGMRPGKLRLVCFDPVGLGSTMAGFMKGLPDTITGGQAWFSAQDIETRLVDLENHMAFVKQKYLGVTFASMDAYNANAGEVEEPYRLVVISDFPARFSDTAAQHLISIATNGPHTGVYTIMMVDEDQKKLPNGFNIEDFRRTANVVFMSDEGSVWMEEPYHSCSLEVDTPPPAKDFERIINLVKEASLAASEVRVPYANFLPAYQDWWKEDSRFGVRLPIGQFGARETQYFNLDEKLLSSALVVGKTGSGKSTLLHILVTGLAILFSPEEVELYLLDFKQVEFKEYAIQRLPHARVVAVKSEREFGLSVLRGLDKELQRRKDIFNSMTSLSEYRTKTNEKLSRIILIADEFQELFTYDDQISNEAQIILDRLIRQGRAFGVNVLLASQTLAGPNTLSSAARNQIPLRVALQCSEADSRLILSEENDRARLLERPGEAIYNSANGRVEGNNRFQVAWLADHEKTTFLQNLRKKTDQVEAWKNHTPIIFDGDESSQIESNKDLTQLIESNSWPARKRGYSALVWMGEPIEIKPHSGTLLRRQSQANVLIIGQNEYEEDALNMIFAVILSLGAQLDPQHAKFTFLNMIDIDSPQAELPRQLAEVLPHEFRVINRRNISKEIEAIYDTVIQRTEEEDGNWPSIYVFIPGLHRARDLRRDENYNSYSFGNSEEGSARPPLSEQLVKICREGPDVGVHVLAWCDTYTNLTRVLERRDINEFSHRVVMQVSQEDSRMLIDSEMASRLGRHRAILYNDEQNGVIEKFRPYRFPSKTWLDAAGESFKKRVLSE